MKKHWKNQVRWTGFESISNWIFTACVACKNQLGNWFLQVKDPVRRTWFFKNQVQMDRAFSSLLILYLMAKHVNVFIYPTKNSRLKINWFLLACTEYLSTRLFITADLLVKLQKSFIFSKYKDYSNDKIWLASYLI